jgi:hypothetical protein
MQCIIPSPQPKDLKAMPLSEKEISDLKSLDAEGSRQEIKTQCHRIHRATHDGSLDRPAVDDALARIAVINKSHDDAPQPAATEPSGPTIAGKPLFEPRPPDVSQPRVG